MSRIFLHEIYGGFKFRIDKKEEKSQSAVKSEAKCLCKYFRRRVCSAKMGEGVFIMQME